MQDIPFTKVHGTGNDFILFFKEECPDIISSPEFIQSICARRTGVGADGVIILSNEINVDFRLDYYNSDGSWETFCANGSRCAALLLKRKGVIGQKANFLSGDGRHEAEIDDSGTAWIKMNPPIYKTGWLEVCGFSGRHVDSGAKHFACETNSLNYKLVEKSGPEIRYDELFAPTGINVNFFHRIATDRIEVITYEKGIEKVMLSCGSGAVAAVYHAAQISKITSPLKIETPGGCLFLRFATDWQDVWLGGPAVLMFESALSN